MIQRGQIYRSADPRDGDVRIQVVSGYARNFQGGSSVTVATIRSSDGKLVRQRSIVASQLHDSPTTKTGNPRKTGWILVSEPSGE